MTDGRTYTYPQIYTIFEYSLRDEPDRSRRHSSVERWSGILARPSAGTAQPTHRNTFSLLCPAGPHRHDCQNIIQENAAEKQNHEFTFPPMAHHLTDKEDLKEKNVRLVIR